MRVGPQRGGQSKVPVEIEGIKLLIFGLLLLGTVLYAVYDFGYLIPGLFDAMEFLPGYAIFGFFGALGMLAGFVLLCLSLFLQWQETRLLQICGIVFTATAGVQLLSYLILLGEGLQLAYPVMLFLDLFVLLGAGILMILSTIQAPYLGLPAAGCLVLAGFLMFLGVLIGAGKSGALEILGALGETFAFAGAAIVFFRRAQQAMLK